MTIVGRLGIALGIALAAAWPPPAAAQPYPSRPLRVICAFPVGGIAAATPELPTVGEALPGFEVNNWIGLFAPAGTPTEIVRRWNGEVTRILQSPDIQSRLPAEGARIVPLAPEQFAAFVKAEIATWAPVVKASGARMD